MHSEPGARSEARSRGIPGSETLPSAPEENLILRAMQHAAERHGVPLPRFISRHRTKSRSLEAWAAAPRQSWQASRWALQSAKKN